MVTQANFRISKTCVNRYQTTGFIESADHFPYTNVPLQILYTNL